MLNWGETDGRMAAAVAVLQAAKHFPENNSSVSLLTGSPLLESLENAHFER